ncbi:MAG TPA: hypothetical protein VIH59_16110 [Candidatus Tectomicrobia bacterium]|jgi:hypothetical protein
MGLLFQLLSESDIMDLSVEELETLKAAFQSALYTNPAIQRELAAAIARILEVIRARREGSTPPPSGG